MDLQSNPEYQSIFSDLQAVFSRVLDKDDLALQPELTAQDVEGWDSMSHIQLIIATEDQFGIKFKASEISKLKNVGEFVELIFSKKRPQN